MYQVDLFCRVIDNWGDAGVCWRLTRQLATEFGLSVRLIIDEVSPLRSLAADVLTLEEGRIEVSLPGVEVLGWRTLESTPPAHMHPAPAVIEAFACDPPEAYIAAMAAQARAGKRPLWINLEYLSAESWVDGVHGFPSPHPRLPLVKHFFVPGFSAKSGGLIRERHVTPCAGVPPSIAHRPPTRPRDSHSSHRARLRIFAFTYPDAPVAALADALAAEVTLAAPLAAQPSRTRAYTTVPQIEFDRVLLEHDLLLVRGEDSFVRAQYAGRPLLWHVYPTADGAHRAKLAAWLDRYCEGLDPQTEGIYRAMATWFISPSAPVPDWSRFQAILPTLAQHAVAWQHRLCRQPDLAQRLVEFMAMKQADPEAKILGWPDGAPA